MAVILYDAGLGLEFAERVCRLRCDSGSRGLLQFFVAMLDCELLAVHAGHGPQISDHDGVLTDLRS